MRVRSKRNVERHRNNVESRVSKHPSQQLAPSPHLPAGILSRRERHFLRCATLNCIRSATPRQAQHLSRLDLMKAQIIRARHIIDADAIEPAHDATERIAATHRIA